MFLICQIFCKKLELAWFLNMAKVFPGMKPWFVGSKPAWPWMDDTITTKQSLCPPFISVDLWSCQSWARIMDPMTWMWAKDLSLWRCLPLNLAFHGLKWKWQHDKRYGDMHCFNMRLLKSWRVRAVQCNGDYGGSRWRKLWRYTALYACLINLMHLILCNLILCIK